MVRFAYRVSTEDSPLGPIHALVATMSRMWLPIWQTCSLAALHRTLLDILSSSALFYLADLAGLSNPAAAIMLHSDTFLYAEAPKYWTSHQSTSKT